MFLASAAVAALFTAQSAPGVTWRPLNAPAASKPKPAVNAAGGAAPSSGVASTKAVPPAQTGGIVATMLPPPMPAQVYAVGTQALQLTCFGGGTANKVGVATINSRSSFSGSVGTIPVFGSGSGSATMMSGRQQKFGDQVDVRLFNGDDRIRMPRTMLPVFRGGKEGWFKLKNVQADARSIRASAAVNLLNNPKVFIDRVTGTISISGKAGDYVGECDVIDESAAPKF